ncbi:MAG: DUF3090 family protein [Anaerolineales bacterium]|nr:DUF3090 family protein [Anaerolineales bacterium]MCA9929836.1 DUF3090 family protein [Anaerolineales bacterium]
MARHIELNPVSHITVGAVGKPGDRTFYLQGSRGSQTISLAIEKEQASVLAGSFESLLKELDEKHPQDPRRTNETVWMDMSLREPVEGLFRVGNMGLGYNEETDQIVLVAYELVDEDEEPNVVSYWVSREQAKLMIPHVERVVRSGRFFDPGSGFSPRKNGHAK